MSGGVDSSVAAWLMMKSGFECTGAMMKLFSNEDTGLEPDNSCCSQSHAEDARAVAFQLGMPFYVFNFAESFTRQVIDRFVDAYQCGVTPNPCIDCNRYLKFGRFLRRAHEMSCDCIATGHYARIEPCAGRYLLKKGVDAEKDQSYVLYMMTQEQLQHTLFPLGEMTKPEVREIALEQGLPNAEKPESQDICFVPNGEYAAFIERYSENPPKKGLFVDLNNKVLGEHRGIHHYTIGQRRGLGLPDVEPRYVCSICHEDNTIVVGSRQDLYATTLLAKNINLIPVERLDAPMRVWAKIRYRQTAQPATVWQLDADTLRVEFDNPQSAITKGQAVVLYDDDLVVGGGTIS